MFPARKNNWPPVLYPPVTAGDEELATFQTVGLRSGRRGDGSTVEADDGDMVLVIRRKNNEEMSAELECELSEKVVNLEALRRIASCGHLDGRFRAVVWKLLLGYLPSEREAWESELTANRLRYTELKEDLLANPKESSRKDEGTSSSSEQLVKNIHGLLSRHQIADGDHPLNLGNTSMWRRYFRDAEIVEQIDRDLKRTHPDIKFFSGDSSFGKNNLKAMRNILLLFAKLNPAIGYVQGMNEVLAPLYYVFSTDPDEENASNVEADTFACFVLLMSDSVDHFCQQLDNSSVGIHCTLSRLSELLRTNDEELWRHLAISSKVNPQFYAFRWITLLLTQEFDLHSILRIWDSLLSNSLGVQDMLLRVCCSMLLCARHKLLTGDFTSNLKLLQHYPQIDLEHLLNVAQQLTLVSSPESPVNQIESLSLSC